MRGRILRRLSYAMAGVGVVAACCAGPATAARPVAVSNAAVDLLAATDALIMTGSDMHTIYPAWIHMAISHYISPSLGGDYEPFPLDTPEEFWPFGGILDEPIDDSIAEGLVRLNSAIDEVVAAHIAAGEPDAPIVVFGFSQSAEIVTEKKRQLKEAAAQGQSAPPLSFVVIGNPSRPNGGINERFEGLWFPGMTFRGATPTDTTFTTVDIARQYDPAADFPLYPLNPFALVNAVMGLIYNHNYEVVSIDPTDPLYNPKTTIQQYGDTTYYFIPSVHLPMLQPFYDLGVPAAVLDAIDPPLRYLVELGYDRSIPFGQPTHARVFPDLAAPKAAVPPARAAARPETTSPVHRELRAGPRPGAASVPGRTHGARTPRAAATVKR